VSILNKYLSGIILILIVIACTRLNPQNETSTPISHTSWDTLLQRHVNSLGLVNYKGFINDSIALNQYLKLLTKNTPNNSWTESEQLAYWVNFYNAFTVKLITNHYPIKSIKDIGSGIQIPFINTPWQISFISIDNEWYSLDDIEHNLIRKNFAEPRIHFALVCAAVSCPTLRNEAYRPDLLESQLNNQAILFLSDTSKNKITEEHIEISKLFRWYKNDFTTATSLISYLNQYVPFAINENADIEYLEYNWNLNEKTN